MTDKDLLFVVQYGSKLYGTSTPTSDTDLKSVYLPNIDNLLLGKKLVATKTREDKYGQPVPDNASMPENGVENEYIPFQTFVRDFVAGQTYAVEMAYAILKQGPSAPDKVSAREFELVKELVENFGNNEVYSMVGFAMKQTFDYVKRGERLNDARKVKQALDVVLSRYESYQWPLVRLDTTITHNLDGVVSTMLVLDAVADFTGLETGTSVNNNKTQRTLEMNGRSYLESTTVTHLMTQVEKLITQYGERSTKAAETDVDFKSLSHAVRVYQQAIELLDTGKVTFPRPNAAELLRIKSGKADLEEVKVLLKKLDAEVLEKMETSTQRKRTPELEAAAEAWLLKALRELYLLS